MYAGSEILAFPLFLCFFRTFDRLPMHAMVRRAFLFCSPLFAKHERGKGDGIYAGLGLVPKGLLGYCWTNFAQRCGVSKRPRYWQDASRATIRGESCSFQASVAAEMFPVSRRFRDDKNDATFPTNTQLPCSTYYVVCILVGTQQPYGIHSTARTF